MVTRRVGVIARLAGVVALVCVPWTVLAAGAEETPEQRCARETRTYNEAMEASWRALHPGETPTGNEWPPYICIGGPEASAAPVPQEEPARVHRWDEGEPIHSREHRWEGFGVGEDRAGYREDMRLGPLGAGGAAPGAGEERPGLGPREPAVDSAHSLVRLPEPWRVAAPSGGSYRVVPSPIGEGLAVVDEAGRATGEVVLWDAAAGSVVGFAREEALVGEVIASPGEHSGSFVGGGADDSPVFERDLPAGVGGVGAFGGGSPAGRGAGVGLPPPAVPVGAAGVIAGVIAATGRRRGGVPEVTVRHPWGEQTVFVVEAPDSPHVQRFDAGIPPGGRATVTRDGGVDIRDSEGGYIRRVEPPWAVDALGRPVPTRYEVDGATGEVIQYVEPGAGVVYPILADPNKKNKGKKKKKSNNRKNKSNKKGGGNASGKGKDKKSSKSASRTRRPERKKITKIGGAGPSGTAEPKNTAEPKKKSAPKRERQKLTRIDAAGSIPPTTTARKTGKNTGASRAERKKLTKVGWTDQPTTGNSKNAKKTAESGRVRARQERRTLTRIGGPGDDELDRTLKTRQPGFIGPVTQEDAAGQERNRARAAEANAKAPSHLKNNNNGTFTDSISGTTHPGFVDKNGNRNFRLQDGTILREHPHRDGSGRRDWVKDSPDGTKQTAVAHVEWDRNGNPTNIRDIEGSTVYVLPKQRGDGLNHTVTAENRADRNTLRDNGDGTFTDVSQGTTHRGWVDSDTGGRVFVLADGRVVREHPKNDGSGRADWTVADLRSGDESRIADLQWDATGHPSNLVLVEDSTTRLDENKKDALGKKIAEHGVDLVTSGMIDGTVEGIAGKQTATGAVRLVGSNLARGAASAGYGAFLGSVMDIYDGMDADKAIVTNTAGAAAGWVAGAAAGAGATVVAMAVAGSVVPGVGTVVGFIAGALAANFAKDYLQDHWRDEG